MAASIRIYAEVDISCTGYSASLVNCRVGRRSIFPPPPHPPPRSTVETTSSGGMQGRGEGSGGHARRRDD